MNQGSPIGTNTNTMTEYTIIVDIQARKLDRDAAGKNGYLDHFDGSLPEDITTGYAFRSPTTGSMQWVETKAFEDRLLENTPLVKALRKEISEGWGHICKNCKHYEIREAVPDWNICDEHADYRSPDQFCSEFIERNTNEES